MYKIEKIDNFGKAFLYHKLAFSQSRSLLQNIILEDNFIAIGASKLGEPIGLVIANIQPNIQFARIGSIFVVSSCRRQGIGTALLSYLEKALFLRGCTKVKIFCPIDRQTTPALKSLLQKLSWFSIQPNKIICKSDTETIIKAPWINREYRLPHGMIIFPWTEIKPYELALIEQTQKSNAWIEEVLNPSLYEENLELLNSLGLRYKQKVVGWMLTTRVSPDTISYDCMFVRQDLRKVCRGIALLVNAIQLQVQAKIPFGIWHIDTDNYPMMRFVKKHMSPYLTSVVEVNDYLKLLTSA